MKYLIFGDLHLGLSKDSEVFHKVVIDYAKWLKHICEERNISNIISLGDIFHDRFNLSVLTLNCAYEFFEILKEYRIDIVQGNHDTYYNNRNDVNSLKPFSKWKNINIHEGVTSRENVTFCGWNPSLDQIPENDIILGHFDIQGFNVQKGKVSTHGFKASDLMKKCKICISGHYHGYQEREYSNGVLYYLGSAFQNNWGEAGEEKYVFILDTDTLKIEKIQNNVSPKHEYITEEKDLNKCKNNFIKIITDSLDKAEDLKKNCSIHSPLKMDTVVEEKTLSLLEEKAEDLKEMDNAEFIKKYIFSLELEEDVKTKIFDSFIQLYNKYKK